MKAKDEQERNKWKHMTTVLKFKGHTIKWDGNYNYILTASRKPGQYEHYISLGSALFGLYKKRVMNNLESKEKYGATLMELKHIIEETKKELYKICVSEIKVKKE